MKELKLKKLEPPQIQDHHTLVTIDQWSISKNSQFALGKSLASEKRRTRDDMARDEQKLIHAVLGQFFVDNPQAKSSDGDFLKRPTTTEAKLNTSAQDVQELLYELEPSPKFDPEEISSKGHSIQE